MDVIKIDRVQCLFEFPVYSHSKDKSFELVESLNFGGCDGCNFERRLGHFDESPKDFESNIGCRTIIFASVQNLSDCTFPKRVTSKLSEAFNFGCLVFCTSYIQRDLMCPVLENAGTLY